MPGGYLYGYDSVGNVWTKLLCNADGELLLESFDLFEDDPTDGEMDKAPTSNWAFDHENNLVIHHTKYTDVESRAAIGGLFNSIGRAQSNIDLYYHSLDKVKSFLFKEASTSAYQGRMFIYGPSGVLRVFSNVVGGGYIDAVINVYKTDHFATVIDNETFITQFATLLEGTPTDGEDEKAPTSNWAYDHENDSSIHFPKYTDLEAQQAVKLAGDLYWIISGNGFFGENPDVDDVERSPQGYVTIQTGPVNLVCSVSLPHGVTVTEVVVNGNAGAGSQTWRLRRFFPGLLSIADLATDVVNTVDSAIDLAVIDNTQYCYFFDVQGLETDDRIYMARIKYTL